MPNISFPAIFLGLKSKDGSEQYRPAILSGVADYDARDVHSFSLSDPLS
jgi:hypothetical protein